MNFVLQASFLEIYNEKVGAPFSILNPGSVHFFLFSIIKTSSS